MIRTLYVLTWHSLVLGLFLWIARSRQWLTGTIDFSPCYAASEQTPGDGPRQPWRGCCWERVICPHSVAHELSETLV